MSYTTKANWQLMNTAPRGSDNLFIGWDGETVSVTWEGWSNDDGVPVYVRSDWISWNQTHWMPLSYPPVGNE